MLTVQDILIVVIGLGSFILYFILHRRLAKINKLWNNIWIIVHCGFGILLWLSFMLNWLNSENFFLGRRTGSLFLITGVIMLFVSDWMKKKKQINDK
ncbi:hypothetical protein A2Y85_05395 [candidate division WOR-3 bacterium RBG_13_43_14]|uniref:Uncharacterized protein n=1 Tax=candidate division WOR-3 bacterium RBG_13_43_14 TaxID=1802590 RepID=A0A1F4UBK5_UNCW3|nr:MAG: hypothetical protein A2Y85_05395 [candidate division WOR-3 bacterium RBG_13_43_14]